MKVMKRKTFYLSVLLFAVLLLGFAVPVSAGENSYTVRNGDYLYRIAREQLGDQNLWEKIYELNKDQISDRI